MQKPASAVERRRRGRCERREARLRPGPVEATDEVDDELRGRTDDVGRRERSAASCVGLSIDDSETRPAADSRQQATLNDLQRHPMFSCRYTPIQKVERALRWR